MSNPDGRGNVTLPETTVQSPICDLEPISHATHAVNADVNANPVSATAPVNSSHTSLREESASDTSAAMGQEARDLAGARQRETSIATTPGLAAARQKGFITDMKYLTLIDADQDVQQVHEQLEEVAERFKDKKTRPRSLMSVFMYLNGFKPGLDRPGKVLIHQLNSSHPPK